MYAEQKRDALPSGTLQKAGGSGDELRGADRLSERDFGEGDGDILLKFCDNEAERWPVMKFNSSCRKR